MKGDHRIKPEKRKELRTNALADFLGRTVSKTRTRGLSWTWIFAGLILVVVGLVVYVYMQGRTSRNQEAWAKVQENSIASLGDLLKDQPDTIEGQAAEFSLYVGFLSLRIEQLLGVNPQEGQKGLADLIPAFEKLAEKCQDDPPRAAEAKYHLAVAKEALATVDERYLDEAEKAFKAIVNDEKLQNTGYGVLAKKRLAQYRPEQKDSKTIAKADQKINPAISKFYSEFRVRSKFNDPFPKK